MSCNMGWNQFMDPILGVMVKERMQGGLTVAVNAECHYVVIGKYSKNK